MPAFGGLALHGDPDGYLTRSDSAAMNGPWTVVVRRADGSLGQHGAVVTYPATTSDLPDAQEPVRVAAVTGSAGRGFILWPLGNGRARIRGDLPPGDLLRIAELTTLKAGRPQVVAPKGFRVIVEAPFRMPVIHEIS